VTLTPFAFGISPSERGRTPSGVSELT